MANALMDSETRTLGFSNTPTFDRRDLAQVGRGTADSYLSAIMAAPEWLLQKMIQDDPYQRGVLQSGPQDRMKAEQRRWNEHQAAQAQSRDYAQGQDYGTGLAMVADPFIDALGAIPAVGKALKLKAPARSGKPFNALAALASERGAIDAQRGIPKRGPTQNVKLDDLTGNPDGLATAKSAFADGEPIVSDKPIAITTLPNGEKRIVDGYHRYINAKRKGIKDIKAQHIDYSELEVLWDTL